MQACRLTGSLPQLQYLCGGSFSWPVSGSKAMDTRSVVPFVALCWCNVVMWGVCSIHALTAVEVSWLPDASDTPAAAQHPRHCCVLEAASGEKRQTAQGRRGSGVQVSTDLAAEGADVDGLMKKMDRLQTAIDAANGWEIDRQVQRATDALRCPPGLFPPLPPPSPPRLFRPLSLSQSHREEGGVYGRPADVFA